ncbi:MAG: PEP/pyruvate-binding domain-containing protein [Desulfarculaceae bacterium]|jgi:pyruvate,water dikinase
MFTKNLFKHLTQQILFPDQAFSNRYQAFRSLLEHDKKAHDLMAELEDYHHNQIKVDLSRLEHKYRQLAAQVSGMIDDLNQVDPYRFAELRQYFQKLDSFARYLFQPPAQSASAPYAIPLQGIPLEGQALAGGKAFNLGIVANQLGLPTPAGFVVTTNAFNYFVQQNVLREQIDNELASLDIGDSDSLEGVSQKLTSAVMDAEVPPEIKDEIFKALELVWETGGEDLRLAMRSSAAAEDTRTSFAGQYVTVLNVGPENILQAYKEVIASKYSPQSLYYRVNYGLSDAETPMAVVALEMINPQTSGVIYTRGLQGPESGNLAIHSVWGLGEMLVSGQASPDVIQVTREEPHVLVKKQLGRQEQQMNPIPGGGTEIAPLNQDQRDSFSLSEDSALTLAQWGMRLENHYQTPQDIEWCQDHEGRLFILQSRPLNLKTDPSQTQTCDLSSVENEIILQGGACASRGIGAGRVFRVEGDSDLSRFPQDAVLVGRFASPAAAKVMNRANAVVTDTGSVAGHLASVAREFGVPMLVDTAQATSRLEPGEQVTVHADGLAVYQGSLPEDLSAPCARRNLTADSPFEKKLRYVISFISPLNLVDPESKSFVPEGARSLHDLIRFTHERAVQAMFHSGEKRLRKGKGAKKLSTSIPMLFYVLDVGGGLRPEKADAKEAVIEDVVNPPLKAVLKGLSHPGIKWGDFTHFNWAEYDRIVMSGGIISAESTMLASYAVVSGDYLNLNLRFGYHFVILDTLCTTQAEDNYIMFRFSGGGDDLYKRSLRAEFLRQVLGRLGFETELKSDLVDARLSGQTPEEMDATLDMIGRLLGATRLMDMYIKDEPMVASFVEEFMGGRYDFSLGD